jgi:hypothetical protein
MRPMSSEVEAVGAEAVGGERGVVVKSFAEETAAVVDVRGGDVVLKDAAGGLAGVGVEVENRVLLRISSRWKRGPNDAQRV